MFYGDTITETRKQFFDSWQKWQRGHTMTALEQQIARVIQEHPEYHFLFNNPDKHLQQAYFPELGETNPFLHLGLHLAIRDQVQLNTPPGIKDIYHQLLKRYDDSLHVEHLMLDCLAEMIWKSQKYQSAPDVEAYIAACKALI